MSVIERIPEFASNHPLLVIALVVTLAMIAFTEYQRLTRVATSVTPSRATRLANNEDAVFIDARPQKDFDGGHLPGARSVPAGEVDSHFKQLEKLSEYPVILYDERGFEAERVAKALHQSGFTRLYQIEGGLPAWRKADLPVESGSAAKANKGKNKGQSKKG
jgi:rhodanese-related sulfurtransferase